MWPIIHGLIGGVLTLIGNYLLEKRREQRKKNAFLQVIECEELDNITRIFDENLFGPMAGHIQIKVPESGPKSNFIDIHAIYCSRFRLRNLSDSPVSKILISPQDVPKAVWFNIKEGKEQGSPEWEKQLSLLLKEEKKLEEGWVAYPIPYLNPYSSSEHEVYLTLASYMPLKKVKIIGGAEGVKFVYKKLNND